MWVSDVTQKLLSPLVKISSSIAEKSFSKETIEMVIYSMQVFSDRVWEKTKFLTVLGNSASIVAPTLVIDVYSKVYI